MSSMKKNTNNLLSYLHNTVQKINQSKLFAGLVVVTLNISSKFVTVKLSKSMESYLKHTFSRDVLIFCIVWMGSREIYISLLLTAVFILFMDFLFNEESSFCILPENFKNYHISLLEEAEPTADEIKNAKQVLERANKNRSGNLAGIIEDPKDATESSEEMGLQIKW
jgi:hypothetical protein